MLPLNTDTYISTKKSENGGLKTLITSGFDNNNDNNGVNNSSKIPVSSLLLLVMIICGNFLSPLFPCELQKILRENMIVKYVVGFLIIFLLIELSNSSEYDTVVNSLVRSAYLYIWFILLTFMDHKILAILIFLFCILYIIKQYNKELENDQEKNVKNTEFIHTLNRVEHYIYYTCMILTIFGIIVQYGKNRAVFGKSFDIKQFLSRTAKCKNETTLLKLNNSIMKNFRHAFT